jgi:integrase
MRPLYAIAAFAGVRWGEIGRLRWEDVKEKEIVVRAVAAKTRSRRIVEISENLQAFLRPPYKPSPLARTTTAAERAGGRAYSLAQQLSPTFVHQLSLCDFARREQNSNDGGE